MNTYTVFWTYRSQRYLIDFDDEATAIRASIHLMETGRLDVVVTKADYEPDPVKVEAAKQRIKDRLAMEWAIGVVT